MKSSKRKWSKNSQSYPQPTTQRAQPSEKGYWHGLRKILGLDLIAEMTDYAQRIHRGLVAEGFDTESDDYYNELTVES